MRTRTIIVLILAVLVIAAGMIYSRVVLKSSANVDKLVARALSHETHTDYVAQVVTTTNYNGKTIKARATVFHQGATEKVEYASPAGRPVWSMTRDGKSYTYLPKENKLLVSENSRLLSEASRSALLLRNYRAVSHGTDRVAGRDAYVVNISSRHNGRPSKKLWIDKQHLTILKSIDYSSVGEKRGSTEMKSIRYNADIRPDSFAMPTDSSVNTVMVCKSGNSMDLFKTVGIPIRLPNYLPVGYKIEGYHLFNSQCNCDHRSAQLTYTDGLNVVSVFQSPKMTCCTDGKCNMAGCGSDKGCAVANCDVAKTGMITRNDRIIVVVGDMLPEDVKRIAESVK
ncbi:MAG: sigma-E factor regulatory protein RseB domain-containing protein [Armatimonadota bacterium]